MTPQDWQHRESRSEIMLAYILIGAFTAFVFGSGVFAGWLLWG